jgi:PKD repeat protein
MFRRIALVVVVAAFAVAMSCSSDKKTNPEPNTGPTASFAVDPTGGPVETVFQFDASGSSDAQDATSALQVRWDWENDGTWDTDWSATKTASHQYGTTGTKTVKLVVKDTDGASDDTTGTVTVTASNTAPVASFTLSPASGTTATTFEFDASGCSDAEDAVSALQVRWDWENDGTWDTGWSTTKTANHQYATGGTKTIKVVVKDTGELTDDSTRTIIVSVAPTVVGITPSDGATDVSPYPIVEIWFSQAMGPSSMDTANFHLDGVGIRAIFYDTIQRRAILFPATIVTPLTEHAVRVGPNVMNDAGAPMGQEAVFHFTAGELDCDHLRDRFEPNNDLASATLIDTDAYYPGLSSCAGSEMADMYRFTLTQATKIRVTEEIAYSDTNHADIKINFLRGDSLAYSSHGASVSVTPGAANSHYFTFLPGTYWIGTGKNVNDSHMLVYHLRIEELAPAPDDEYEDNDFPDQATPVLAGLYENLRGAFVDADYYSISLVAGQILTVTATEVTSTGTTRRLQIEGMNGEFYTGHTDTANPAVESWTATTDGTYLIQVRWWTDNVIYNMNVEVSG